MLSGTGSIKWPIVRSTRRSARARLAVMLSVDSTSKLRRGYCLESRSMTAETKLTATAIELAILSIARGRIGQKFDIADGLPQLIEHRDASADHQPAERGRLHTVQVTIKQGHAEHVLEVCDGPRNGRLRCAELLCRLSHAAGLNDRHEDTQILKLETALDAIGQFHGEAPSYRLRYAVMPKQHFPSMTALHRLVQVSFG